MNKHHLLLFLFIPILTVSTLFAQYPPREDAIWARTTTENITLDGVLDETAWSSAEELSINYGMSNGMPWTQWYQDGNGGSGIPVDSTHATVKFLVNGNNLYLGFTAPDVIVLGSTGWANWDGILMSVKSRATQGYLDGGVSSPTEYFYTYWYSGADSTFGFPGCPPIFRGTFENAYLDTVSHNPHLFDGYWKVDGLANDSTEDNGWVAEIKINLDTLGIDVTKPGGDIIEMNFSIWDKDAFPTDPLASYTDVSGWQTIWNNNDNPGRIHASPDVTTETAVLPDIEYDFVVPSAANDPDPTIDGVLDEGTWEGAYSFDLAWDNLTLRESYSGIGPYRSGRFQPELDLDGDGTVDPKAAVVDGAFANIKMFFKGKYLYLGADVQDQIIQGRVIEKADLFDGVSFRFLHRTLMQEQHMPEVRQFSVYFDSTGQAAPLDHLVSAVDTGWAEYAVALTGNSVVDDENDIDEGYSVEMKIDLEEALGYQTDLGDGLIFGGVLLRDGDVFSGDDILNSYGNRTWWFGESGNWSVAYGIMDPDIIVAVEDNNSALPKNLELYGNYPNPFNPATKIKFSTPQAGDVEIAIFDILGRKVKTLVSRNLAAGIHERTFSAGNLASGVYFYKIMLTTSVNKNEFQSKTGKMILLK